MMSSCASGCSIIIRSRSSSACRRECGRGRRACRPSWRRPCSGTSGQRSRTARDERHVPARADLQLDAPVALTRGSWSTCSRMPSTVGSMPRLTPERISLRVPPSSLRERLAARAGEAGPSRPSPGRPWRSGCRAPWPSVAAASSGWSQPRPGRPGPGSRAGCASRSRSSRSSSTGRTRWRTRPSLRRRPGRARGSGCGRGGPWCGSSVVNGRTSGRRARNSSTERSVWLMRDVLADTAVVRDRRALKPTATKPAAKACLERRAHVRAARPGPARVRA